MWSPLRLKVTRMTSGAIRLECRIRPVDRFRIALMACGTGQVAPVIQRLERQAGMREVVRQPAGGVVADATVLLRVEVTLILASRRNAVVARRARSQDLRMVDSDNWRPPTGLWQSSQTLVVWACVAFLPVASVPLWQLKQLPVMLT